MNVKEKIIKIVEIIILNLLVFFFFNQFLPIKEEFFSLNIHPLVVVVLIFALRYGLLYAVLSATCASLVYLFFYYYLGRDLFIFFIDFHYYKFPLIFYFTAIIFGRFKDQYENEKMMMKNQILELEHNAKRLKEENDNYEFMYKELKMQIIGAEHSLLSLYDIAKSLQTLEPEDVFTKAIGIFIKFIKVEVMSIYTVEKNGMLRLKIRYGNSEDDKSSIDINRIPDYQKVVNEKIALKRTRNSHDDFPLFAAPVINEKGDVIAITCVEGLAFERVTDYIFTLFKVITEWVNQSLNYAIEYSDKIQDATDNSMNIVSFEKFKSIKVIHKERLNAFNLEYCILKYSLNGENANELVKQISASIRRVDYVTFDEEHKDIYLLFPATKKKHLSFIQNKLNIKCNINLVIENE